MTPDEFVEAVHKAMETPRPPKGYPQMAPTLANIGKAIAVQKVLDQYRDELPHVESTATMEVPLPVFKELSGQ